MKSATDTDSSKSANTSHGNYTLEDLRLANFFGLAALSGVSLCLTAAVYKYVPAPVKLLLVAGNIALDLNVIYLAKQAMEHNGFFASTTGKNDNQPVAARKMKIE